MSKVYRRKLGDSVGEGGKKSRKLLIYNDLRDLGGGAEGTVFDENSPRPFESIFA